MPILRDIVRGQSRGHLAVFAFVMAALLLGGGGEPWPLLEMTAELVMLGGLLAWFRYSRSGDGPAIPWTAWAIVALVIALPLAQLCPLPPSIWHALPGREVEREALNLVGQGDSWRPFSLTPDRTLASLLGMTIAVMAVPMVASLNLAGRTLVMAAIALAGVMSLALGVAQVLGAGDSVFRWAGAEQDYLSGFEANRNSEADVLLIAMVGFAGLMRGLKPHSRLLRRRYVTSGGVAFVSVLFSLGIVLTQSRSGMALLPLALIAVVLVAKSWRDLTWRSFLVAVVALAVALGGAALVMHGNTVVARALDRFDSLEDFRGEIWKDTHVALGSYVPVGAGMGSFRLVFNAVERLEIVSDLAVNRAHDDYLEFYLEAGVPGLVVASLVILLVLVAGIRNVFLSSSVWRAQQVCAIFILLEIFLHSFVDYPLRSLALSCMAGAGAGLLLTRQNSSSDQLKVKV